MSGTHAVLKCANLVSKCAILGNSAAVQLAIAEVSILEGLVYRGEDLGYERFCDGEPDDILTRNGVVFEMAQSWVNSVKTLLFVINFYRCSLSRF